MAAYPGGWHCTSAALHLGPLQQQTQLLAGLSLEATCASLQGQRIRIHQDMGSGLCCSMQQCVQGSSSSALALDAGWLHYVFGSRPIGHKRPAVVDFKYYRSEIGWR
jgi:hypothetical protein